MPLVSTSSYRAPLLFRSGHLQTIYPAVVRKQAVVTSKRERIDTPDGDFLDLDWHREPNSSSLVVLSHGLEGNSKQSYMQGMARIFKQAGWNVLAWNYRGCSGELNRKLQSYHSGATEDLQTVLNHVWAKHSFDSVVLIGFSLGGNLILKYLGDCAKHLDTRIQAAVALSVPCDLASSSRRLEAWENRLYMRRFLRTLRKKIRQKMPLFPGQLKDQGLDKMSTFREFDGTYTAPIHGFKDADDYWTRCSCKQVLPSISIPTLLINAADDPFLPPECYPTLAAQDSDQFYLEIPTQGGHMGFVSFGHHKTYWSERRALEFIEKSITA